MKFGKILLAGGLVLGSCGVNDSLVNPLPTMEGKNQATTTKPVVYEEVKIKDLLSNPKKYIYDIEKESPMIKVEVDTLEGYSSVFYALPLEHLFKGGKGLYSSPSHWDNLEVIVTEVKSGNELRGLLYVGTSEGVSKGEVESTASQFNNYMYRGVGKMTLYGAVCQMGDGKDHLHIFRLNANGFELRPGDFGK